MLRASRDLWVESLGDRVRIENVLTGRDIVVSPEVLDSVNHCSRNDSVFSDECPNHGAHVVRAVDRLLKSHPREALPSDALERFTLCRSRCLEELEISPETKRDLRAVFRTAETFLREDTERQFDYTDGLLQVLWQRPNLEYALGQLPCMPETTQRRVSVAQPFLKDDSRCLILGDDDLMGLCWGLMYEQDCDVFELDQRLLDFYEGQPREGLSFHQRDLTQGLPGEFHGLYDIIFTDPMYGRQGMNMFLLCCSQGLSRSPQARLFLNTRPDLIEDGDRLPERLADLGLRIVKNHSSFSRYRFPEKTRRMALDALSACPLPRYFLRGLLKVPYYYSDLMEVARIS
jgi:branched-chain polyamine synthase A-like protein